jgi:hypothetical protein
MDVRSTPWRSTHSQRLKPGGPGAVARGLLQGRAQLLVAILLPVPENYGRRFFAFTLLFHVNAKLIVLLKEYVPSHESIAKSGSYFLATLTARIGTRTVVALLRANKQQSVANVGLQRSALGTKDRSGPDPTLAFFAILDRLAGDPRRTRGWRGNRASSRSAAFQKPLRGSAERQS